MSKVPKGKVRIEVVQSQCGGVSLCIGDEHWYRDWPSTPNPDYVYLERIVQAVREALEAIREPA